MKTSKSTERKEIEEKIEGQKWFRLLPKYTRKNLLNQPSDFLALLLKQEAEIVTTKDETDFAFGYSTEGKPVIRIPEFSATSIGAAKLNKLKLQPYDKARFIIENINLMQRPLSNKKKNLIEKILKKIGDKNLWELGALLEEKTRDLQLRIETGRMEVPYLLGITVDRKKEAETPGIMLRNYLWLWKQIGINIKTAKFHRSVSSLYFSETIRSEEEKSMKLYQVECECGKMTTMFTIGPFSALKLASSFPIDDPERYRFWEHKYGCRTTADEFCYCYSSMFVRERTEKLKTPELLDEICPVCNGEGDDPKASQEYELINNITLGFKCPACKGVGKVTEKNKEWINFHKALKDVQTGISNQFILYALLPHLTKKDRRQVFDWRQVGEYYATQINPQTRIIAIPVPGKALVITQETNRLEEVYFPGDSFPDKEIVLTPLILEIKNIEDIPEPEKIEFCQEAEAFAKGEKIPSVETMETSVNMIKIQHEDLRPNGLIKAKYTGFLNPNYVEYSFPGKVFNITIEHFSKGWSTRNIPKIGQERQELVHKILGIPGVTNICLQSSSISITKEKAFSWEDVEPRLRALFEEYKLGDTSLLLKDILPEKAPEVIAGQEEENGTKKKYHTTVLLTNSSTGNFLQEFWEQEHVRHNQKETINMIGHRGYEILDLIFRNDLIKEVFIEPYCITVRKNTKALWANVDSVVMDAIIKEAEK